MTIRHLMFSVPVLCVLSGFSVLASADDITINYDYMQKPQVDFSKMPKGALKIFPFTDTRGVEVKQISDSATAEQAVADIVNDALVQAFEAGGATLVEDGQALTLNGELTEVQVTDKDGAFEVTIRTHVTLKNGSRTAYDTIIFGRDSGATVDAATRAALDKLVNSLILDDYFLMEVI